MDHHNRTLAFLACAWAFMALATVAFWGAVLWLAYYAITSFAQ
jgi:hypothetical protein